MTSFSSVHLKIFPCQEKNIVTINLYFGQLLWGSSCLKKRVDAKPTKNIPEGFCIVCVPAANFPLQEPVVNIPQPVLQEAQWQCGLCKFNSVTQQEMLNHTSLKHSIRSQFKCGYCSVRSSVRSSFDAHFAAKHPTQQFRVSLTQMLHILVDNNLIFLVLCINSRILLALDLSC